MMARGIKGAIIYGILGASVYGWLVIAYDPYNDFAAGSAGWAAAEATWPEIGFGGMPEETLGLRRFIGDNLAIHARDRLLFVDIFDTAGTLYSVERQAGYVNEDDELKLDRLSCPTPTTIAGSGERPPPTLNPLRVLKAERPA